MKALDEYFLMLVFTLLLNRVHVFANFMFYLNRETKAVKELSIRFQNTTAEVGQEHFVHPLQTFSSKVLKYEAKYWKLSKKDILLPTSCSSSHAHPRHVH